MAEDEETSLSQILSWGAYGAVLAGAVILLTRFCLTGGIFSAEIIRRKLELNLSRKMSERARLRRALRWETLKLLGFGAAEVFDVISDWFSIIRMQEEVNSAPEGDDNRVYLRVYAFLGGCSFLVASYALLQRASIQAVINEHIHNDYIGSLAQGGDIKDARKEVREPEERERERERERGRERGREREGIISLRG